MEHQNSIHGNFQRLFWLVNISIYITHYIYDIAHLNVMPSEALFSSTWNIQEMRWYYVKL